MNGITWGALEYFWVIALVFLMSAIMVWYRFFWTKRIIAILAGNQARSIIRNYSVVKLLGKSILYTLGLLFLCSSLLRPQWHEHEETVSQQGRDLFIALDISRSMLVQDCPPNRLECAKKKIKKLLSYLTCERVGLILFSGSAFVQCPLTNDFGAFSLFLDQVDVETISSGSTALGQALNEALKAFAQLGDKKNKLLLIFTDGEDFSSDLSGYKKEAQEQNLRVFTLGVGTTEGAPIPVLNHEGKMVDHQKDKQGKIVISRLNEGLLSALSNDAGGIYIRMADSDDDIYTLVKKVESFEKESVGDKKINQREEQYHYFLLVSLLCFGLEWLW